jgi:cytochrome c oxidase cbb3-type subunit I/II
MPKYPWLLSDELDFSVVQPRVDAMAMLGVPYGAAITRAEPMAREQAKSLAAEIRAQGGPSGLETKKIVALVAYLQRLGTDIKKMPGAAPQAPVRPVAERPAKPEHAQNDKSSPNGEGG